MKIAVPRETTPNETRVAASPETVKKFIGLGLDVTVEAGAGAASSFADEAYREAGAEIVSGYGQAVSDADILIKVRAPSEAELSSSKAGQTIIAVASPWSSAPLLKSAADKGVDLFAMDLMPRITRAQSMDVLSSQSNLAGYKAVIDGAAYYGRAMPMMMTAAGTVAPAKVFVMGAGVAGLQAIATARRLGAVVSATDVRYAAKEQVESLGATFVTVDEEEMKSAETEGGYAKEMSDDFKKRQAEFVAEHIKKQNIVITTALIPGRPAPELVSEQMVRSMQPGSVIVDIAAEQGGNVAVTRPGEAVDVDGVVVVGFENVSGRLATDASSLYARNVYNFFSTFFDKDSSSFPTDWDDEIIKSIVLTRKGAIIHPNFSDSVSSAVPTSGDTVSVSDTSATDEADDGESSGTAEPSSHKENGA